MNESIKPHLESSKTVAPEKTPPIHDNDSERTQREKLCEVSRRAVHRYQSARHGGEIAYGLLPEVY